ncbi:hypothetical protein GOODEAATRI_032420, partial [Goodea atripinnis]
SSSPSSTSGTPSQTLGIGRGIPRVLEEMMSQVIPLGVQLALAQGRSHARYGQLFWQPWPRLTWTMHPWPGQWETHFFAPPFEVPPSPAFLEELQRCWRDPRSFSHHGRDAQILACMRNPGDHGLDRMPPVDHCIASLVLSPDEALRERARCPSAQCRVTDDFLCRANDIAARMARIGNSLSVLLLAQSQMLQPGIAGASLGDTNDAALQAFGLMSRELGRLLQSLRRLQVIPDQLFGPEAERALERRRQSSQAPEAWGGCSGAMGSPALQPRRRDVWDPRHQFRTTTPAQFAQRSRAVAEAWRQPGVERAPPRGALAGPDRSRRPPRGRSRRQRAA